VKRHVVLVGLPGSGKTTVGQALADALGRPFVDLDQRIVASQGLSVAGLWESNGEAAFRRLEQAAMREALAGADSVIAPGGGWAAIPGELSQARELAFIIYLRVRAETAALRAGGQGGQGGMSARPLLGDKALQQLGELLEKREQFYRLADLTIDNEGSERDAVALICEAMSLQYKELP
jgi:shikimate kinase